MIGWPTCPMNGLACKAENCAWFCKEERRCAVALLPGMVDFLVRIAATKPYETEEKEE